jgi:hypothetical protein
MIIDANTVYGIPFFSVLQLFYIKFKERCCENVVLVRAYFAPVDIN